MIILQIIENYLTYITFISNVSSFFLFVFERKKERKKLQLKQIIKKYHYSQLLMNEYFFINLKQNHQIWLD